MTLGDWPPDVWAIFAGEFNHQRLHHHWVTTNHQLNGCCDINHQLELLHDVTCVIKLDGMTLTVKLGDGIKLTT